MRVFMAGAITRGAVTARWNVERRSSAMPCANFPSTLAVAGATTIASSSRASSTWRTVSSALRSKVSRSTGRRDSVCRVSGATNCSALRVRITRTSHPAWVRPRTISGAL
jgi:hypothetical protein